MKTYTDKQTIENYLMKEIDDAFDSQLDEWIDAVSLYMDSLANRKLMAGADDETLKFDGEGGSQFTYPDIQSITTLTVDDIEIESDDYYLYPANSPSKNRIVSEGRSFNRGRQNVQIIGKFGKYADGELANDLKLACTIFVAGIINDTQSSDKKIKSQTVGRYAVSYADEKGWADFERAMDIVKSHRITTF